MDPPKAETEKSSQNKRLLPPVEVTIAVFTQCLIKGRDDLSAYGGGWGSYLHFKNIIKCIKMKLAVIKLVIIVFS